MLLKEDILGADDLKRERVETPDWPCRHVWVRTMPGIDRDSFEEQSLDGDPGSRTMRYRNLRGRLAAWTIVDEGGQRVFADEDADAVGQKSAAMLDRVFDVASRLNGLSDKDVKDLAKNLSGAQGGASGSD